MFDLSGLAEIECSECKHLLHIDGSDILVELVGVEERKMGPETFYSGSSIFNCPECENEIEIVYEAYEYPMGALNHSDISTSGAEIIRGFEDIDVSFQEEIYSYEKQTKLYIPKENIIVTNLNESITTLVSQIVVNPELLYKISSRQFEELIANIFSKHNFQVELTSQTRDGGRDIIAIKTDELDVRSKYIIECKRYSRNRPVRVDLVRNLYGVQQQEGANKSVLATTSYFTPDAKKFAETTNTTEWAMDLKNYNDILSWIKDTRQ